jgi:hypothetical protein
VVSLGASKKLDDVGRIGKYGWLEHTHSLVAMNSSFHRSFGATISPFARSFSNVSVASCVSDMAFAVCFKRIVKRLQFEQSHCVLPGVAALFGGTIGKFLICGAGVAPLVLAT